jgi:hypothetical protein
MSSVKGGRMNINLREKVNSNGIGLVIYLARPEQETAQNGDFDM